MLVAILAASLLWPAPCAAAAGDEWKDDWEVAEGFSLDIDAEGFSFPSAIAFVPNPGPRPEDPLYFVTELRGKVKVVTNDRSVHTFAENFFELTPAKELPEETGELGLAGIALEPERGWVFVSFVYQDKNKILRNNIVRFDSKPRTFAPRATGMTAFTDIFSRDVSWVSHQIGAMVIQGNVLYVSVADGGQAFHSQNPDVTLGKVLRMTLDGRPLPDNPFYVDDDIGKARNFVWALGLRNPFGLAAANGRLFAAENGLRIDRFLEIRRGQNYRWDGTDWSIGTNAPLVFGPAVSPVQMAWLPADGRVFPEPYRSKLFVALAASKSDFGGIATLAYDFEQSRMASRPEQFVRRRGKTQVMVGTAFGPDGLYVVPLYPVRRTKDATGVVLKASYNPQRGHPNVLGRNEAGRSVMIRKNCYNCHGENAGDVHVGPPLDSETLIPRIVAELESAEYRRSLGEIDALDTEPYRSFREARRQVMAAEGAERARRWIKYRVLDPTFDRKTALMPKLGLKPEEAEAIADYLVQQNVAKVEKVGALGQLARRYVPERFNRRQAVGVFGLGCVVGGLSFLVPRIGRRYSRRGRGRR
jgi:glucose/arabinose dehydrogenase